MTYRGRVKDGVISLDGGAFLPDGTLVVVAPLTEPERVDTGCEDPLFAIGDLAVETGISDLASQIDHYLYGHPRTNDGR